MCDSIPQISDQKLQSKTRRKKLWEIHIQFHCPIIGTCLTMKELRRLYVRARYISDTPQVKDHDIHIAFVNDAGDQGGWPAKLVQKTLDKKFHTTIARFAKAKNSKELTRLWKASTEKGEIAGPFWAILSHPAASDELLQEIYGEVHMMSHIAGASTRTKLRRFEVLENESVSLREELDSVTAQGAREKVEQYQIITALNRRLTNTLQTEHKLKEAEAHLKKWEDNTEIANLRGQVSALQDKLAYETSRTNRIEQDMLEGSHRANVAEQQVSELLKELEGYQQGDPALASHLAPANDEFDQENTHPELNGRCILYVGGRAKLAPHFRSLVEQYGGRFLYHDGGLQERRARLSGLLEQADAVLCPLDCISHDACWRIKQFCKRNAKPFVMLRNTGVNSFANALGTCTE